MTPCRWSDKFGIIDWLAADVGLGCGPATVVAVFAIPAIYVVAVGTLLAAFLLLCLLVHVVLRVGAQ